MSADEKQLWANLDAVIVYFRNLGVASAVGVGALAIIKYSEKLLPGAGVVPFAVGGVLLLLAFFLVVFIGLQFVRVNFTRSKTWKMLVATISTLIIGLLFARAGWMTAVTALNSPQPQPALQKPAVIAPTGTQIALPSPAASTPAASAPAASAPVASAPAHPTVPAPTQPPAKARPAVK